MSKNYKVIWAKIAKNDLAGIIEYITPENPSNARKIFTEIKEKAASLYHSPERGRIIPELQGHGIMQYRELIVPPWRIIYKISEMNVYILSIFDSRQNVEDILFKRLIKY